MLKSLIRRVVPESTIRAGMKFIRTTPTRFKTSAIVRSGRAINLDLGSPVRGQGGFLTVDICGTPDLNWDLVDPLPFPEGTVSRIYSSHVLEHFTYRHGLVLLKDWRRVLKPGGILEVSVPDGGLFLRGYGNPKAFDRSLMGYAPAVISNDPIDIVNYMAFMDGHHKHLFEAGNLVAMLRAAGFEDARAREFDPEIDPPSRRAESIYAMAKRPPNNAAAARIEAQGRGATPSTPGDR